ncbi:MAG TPA: hypothetical protein VFA55_01255 [Candidatus Kapabacteria bacterium]|nr:hypothetical protein [Candidatus Kapabacteria bacterium]
MKQLIVLLALITLVTTGYSAGKKKSAAKQKNPDIVITGYLVDVHCAQKMMQKEDVAVQAKQHERSCDLMPECEASGYGVFTVVPKTTTHASDVDFYKLNAEGNKEAVALLQKLTQKDNVLVTVTGSGMVHVKSIEPAQQ